MNCYLRKKKNKMNRLIYRSALLMFGLIVIVTGPVQGQSFTGSNKTPSCNKTAFLELALKSESVPPVNTDVYPKEKNSKKSDLKISSSENSGLKSEEIRKYSAPGLLILTHGSPSPNWKKSVSELTERVRAANREKKIFHAIAEAHLEFCQPDAASGITTLEKAGCDRIVVVPAFIFPTSHSHFDVPAVLGLYSSASIRQVLREENARVAAPSVPITMTQTLSEGDLLKQFVTDEVKKISKDPAHEVLILIAHGDENHFGLIDPIMKKIVTSTCGQCCLSEGNWTYCEVGQSYNENVVPLIQEYSAQGKRPLVVGLYLVTSARKIDQIGRKFHDSANIMIPSKDHGSGKMTSKTASNKNEEEKPENAVFSQSELVYYSKTADFILRIASEAL